MARLATTSRGERPGADAAIAPAAAQDLHALLDLPDAAASVPPAYRGLWRRTLLTTGDGRIDRDTHVFWMQTARVHIDIRVPADRETFGHATALADLTREQLAALATQMGFAGVTTVATTVETAAGRMDCCTWHRQIDFSPPSNARDTGTMRFETQHVVLEDGIDAVYHERWERDPLSVGVSWAMSLSHEDARAAGFDSPAVFIARTGDFFMFARSRSSRAQAMLASDRGKRLVDVVRDPALDIGDVRELLDFEISLGRVRSDDGARWTVELSTLPWREGQAAFEPHVGAALDALGATLPRDRNPAP